MTIILSPSHPSPCCLIFVHMNPTVGNNWLISYLLYAHAGEVLEGRWTEAANFLSGSVKKRTHKEYHRKLELFNSYRLTLSEDVDPGEYFQLCASEEQRTQELILFVRHLYTFEGKRESEVTSILSGISYCVDLAGYDSTFLHSKAARRAVKACSRSSAESRDYNSKRLLRDKDPVTGTILGSVRDQCWKGRSWSTKADLDARGKWLAIALGYDMGSRIGNVTRKDGNTAEDHCIRSMDVSVEIVNKYGAKVVIQGSESLRLEIAKGRADQKLDVRRGWLTLVSSKTVRSLKTQLQPKVLERRTPAESQLLDDLVEWMIRSGTKDTDELLTRYDEQGSRRSITRNDATTALKKGAAAVGLDPKRYSSKSLRGGLATAAAEAGMPKDELNARGGWTPGSKVPSLYYTSQSAGSNDRGGMAILANELGSYSSALSSERDHGQSWERTQGAGWGSLALPGLTNPGRGESYMRG